MAKLKKVKCVVFGRNAGGEPDAYCTTITVTEEQYQDGRHYDDAEAEASGEGFDPAIVADQNDNVEYILKAVKWLNKK